MRPETKRAVPRYPQRIAVVTSPRGKAVHDVIRTLARRYPVAVLLVAGVAVEGAGAPSAIVEGLAAAASASPDVILLVRGGGSYEDLMPFNDEGVARAVAACPVPVVTGIGHEPDTSIADMVADMRASTPTAAAEAVAPSVLEIADSLAAVASRLGRALDHQVRGAAHRVQLLAHRPVLCDSTVMLARAWQALDHAAAALVRAIPARVERDRQDLVRLRERFVLVGPRIAERALARVDRGAAQIEALSPLAILERGYSVAYGPDGRTALRSADQVEVGEALRLRLHRGILGVRVETTESEG
jgi:exodeoxyribonuclease VII large subunit